MVTDLQTKSPFDCEIASTVCCGGNDVGIDPTPVFSILGESDEAAWIVIVMFVGDKHSVLAGGDVGGGGGGGGDAGETSVSCGSSWAA